MLVSSNFFAALLTERQCFNTACSHGQNWTMGVTVPYVASELIATDLNVSSPTFRIAQVSHSCAVAFVQVLHANSSTCVAHVTGKRPIIFIPASAF
jgi:hypothetical protein